MKKVLGVLGAIVFFLVVLAASGIGNVGGRAAADALMQPSKKEIMALAVERTKAKLPLMADSETRLDAVFASQEHETLSYSYTLINWTADQLTAADMQRMKQNVINQTCSSQEKTLLPQGIALSYQYKSKDGTPVQEFRIAPGKCIYDPFDKQYGLIP